MFLEPKHKINGQIKKIILKKQTVTSNFKFILFHSSSSHEAKNRNQIKFYIPAKLQIKLRFQDN